MVKGKGTRDGRETILLGLSFENLKRLKQDKPIVIWREEMDIGTDIIIFAAETEERLIDLVQGPETIVHRIKNERN